MMKRTQLTKKDEQALLKVLPKYQVQWLNFYYAETTFEPMHIDELIDGSITFDEAFKSNVDWFESWSSDVMSHVSHRPSDEYTVDRQRERVQ